MLRRVVISGCSGGGKSSLLAALAARGFAVVEEPGRRIVRAELAAGGRALPWGDAAAFARRAIALAIEDWQAAEAASGTVFFDRGLIDAAVHLAAVTDRPLSHDLIERHPYDARVFLAPPWPELFATDDERRHDFAAAEAEYRRLRTAYPDLGYRVTELPKSPVAARAAFVLAELGASQTDSLKRKTPPGH